jgi:uncharacterized RDD family membrane protein YckC
MFEEECQMTHGNQQRSILAGNGNRAAAFLLDVTLLVFLMGTVSESLGDLRPFILPLIALGYVVAMPLTPLQGTLGKWVCRIKICDRRGNRLGLRASLLRALATFGWFAAPFMLGQLIPDVALRHQVSELWMLLLFLPWISIGFMPRCESLFDLLAGSLVVRVKVTPEDINSFESIQKPRVLNGIGTALLFLLLGVFFSMIWQEQRVRSMKIRIVYAIIETRELRKQIEAFHEAEKRWPIAREINLPDWSPYPDGGGYRLQDNGTVVITFSVLPELKGRSITFVPKWTASGTIEWQCSADSGIERRYLPRSCR